MMTLVTVTSDSVGSFLMHQSHGQPGEIFTTIRTRAAVILLGGLGHEFPGFLFFLGVLGGVQGSFGTTSSVEVPNVTVKKIFISESLEHLIRKNVKITSKVKVVINTDYNTKYNEVLLYYI